MYKRQGIGVQLAEERGFRDRGQAQRFQPAGTRGLDVEPPVRHAADGGVDCKFVRAGMHADLIAEMVGHRNMHLEFLVKLREVADIIDAFLEFAAEAGRHGFENHAGLCLLYTSQDLMAGLTVAAVALPLALAFGVSAGATAACGLVTAIVAGLVISALTGGYYQISGPTGAMAAILGSLIGTYGMQGMFVATFLAGIMLLIAAVLHLGNLTAFVPAPVITGFTSGIAVIIACLLYTSRCV